MTEEERNTGRRKVFVLLPAYNETAALSKGPTRALSGRGTSAFWPLPRPAVPAA